MQINYFERDGDLWFFYEEKIFNKRGYRIFESSGVVPEEKVSDGSKAVRLYVEEKVEQEIQKQKEDVNALVQYRKNFSLSIEARHRDVALRGKMYSADGVCLEVDLEEPYQAYANVNFGWGAAVSGKFIFDQNDSRKFSTYAIDSARRLLIKAYQEEEHRRRHQVTIDLADDLNDGRNVRPPFRLNRPSKE